MGFNKGLDANIKVPAGSKTGGVDRLAQILSKVKGGIQVGRVTDIILNDQYPNIEQYGGVNGIGTIFFELNNRISEGVGNAKPFFPQMSSYPLVNEMVLIFKLPTTQIGLNTNEKGYYYINMISLWNHPHHNAYPNPTNNPLDPELRQDYQQIEAGSVRRVTDGSTEIELNSPLNPSQATFKERSNIHPLLPFAGDNIYQGRWGNSIRLGSTARPTNSSLLNDWSSVGENGDPIIILRNGQSSEANDQGWTPITEKINEDISSIYLSTTQKLPIVNSSERYFSYNEAPESPNQYTGAQVIINSDRLILNSKTDHILLSSEQSINLSANSSLNLDSPEFVLDAGDIKFGNNNASESLILGDTFLQNLNHLVTGIEYLCIALQGSTIWPIGVPVPDGVTATPASELLARAQAFKAKVAQYKSTVSKTI